MKEKRLAMLDVSLAPQFTRYMWTASLKWLFVTGLLILVVYIIAHCSSLNRTTFFSLYVCCPVSDLTLELQEDMVLMSLHSGEDTKTMHNMCRGCADKTEAQPQRRGGALQVHQHLDRESAPTYKNDGDLICFSNLQKEVGVNWVSL
jgi:hypothetical protein